MQSASTTQFSRRTLLRSGLAGLGLAALAGGGIALRGTRLRPLPRGGLKVLTPQEYAILAAVADRVCPEPRPGVPGASALDVAGIADGLFVGATEDGKEGVKTALAILENGLTGALFFERITPFTALSPQDQDRTLEAFRASKVGVRRSIYRALSSMVGSLYYGHPDVWPALGYPGPPDKLALRAAYPEQIVDFGPLLARPQGG